MSKAYNGMTKIKCAQITQETVGIYIENPYTGTTEVQGATWAAAIADLVALVEGAVEDEFSARLRRIMGLIESAEAALAIAKSEAGENENS